MDNSPHSFIDSDLFDQIPDPEDPCLDGFLEPTSYGFLLVHLLSAHNLISDFGQNVYCSLKVGTQRAKSEVIERQLSPKWDETFNFIINNTDQNLKVVVLSKDILSACELCSVEVPLRQLFVPSSHWEIKYFRLKFSKTGYIELGARYIPAKTSTSPPGTDRYGFFFEGSGWKVSTEEQEKAFATESVDWQCIDRPPNGYDPTKKGIGLSYKATFWEKFARKRPNLPENLFERNCYKTLLKQEPLPIHMRDIESDIPRTFPGHAAFESDKGKQALRRILKAMTIWNPSVGYCQSMNNVAALMLLVTDEERAFRLSVILIYYIIGDYHSSNMLGLQVDQYVLKGLIKQCLPDLSNHLVTLSVNTDHMVSLITDWFMNIFSCLFPFPTVLRVWDLLFSEGSSSAMVRTSLAILKSLEKHFLEVHDLVELHQVLRKPNSLRYNWDEIIDSYKDLPSTREIDRLRTKATYKILEQFQEAELKRLKESVFTFSHLKTLKLRLFVLGTQKISREQVLGIFETQFADIIWEEPLSKLNLLKAFELENQQIDVREYLLGICPFVTGSFLEKTEFCFRLFDQDQNSKMEREEFGFLIACQCKNLGIPFLPERVDEAWKGKAEDFMTLQEFRTLCTNQPFRFIM